MDTALKTGIDAAKTASNEQFKNRQKLQVIWSEIKQLIKSLHQAKEQLKKKKMKDKKSTYHQKKRQQIIDDLRLF